MRRWLWGVAPGGRTRGCHAGGCSWFGFRRGRACCWAGGAVGCGSEQAARDGGDVGGDRDGGGVGEEEGEDGGAGAAADLEEAEAGALKERQQTDEGGGRSVGGGGR